MTASKIQDAQAQLSAVLIDNLSSRQAQGLLEAVAEAFEVPIEQLSLLDARRDRAGTNILQMV
jgi:hypothetical protein